MSSSENYTEQAIQLKSELDKLRPLSNEDEQRIMQKFRLEWNFHSNHLEGNTLTYGETKALLLFNITAQGKPLKDHIEITGHNEAVNWIIDVIKEDRPLTENFIRQIHKLLLKEPYEVDAITPDGKPTKRKITVGEYKTVPNHVKTKTGEIFRFATPEETPSKMYDLIEWYRKEVNKTEVSAILLATEFHYKFIRIHPFDDGNGRTARILMNFILMKLGYPPVIIKTEDKQNYFSALQQADAGQITPFINYIAKNLVHSLNLMISGAKGENIDEDNDIDKEIELLKQKINSIQTKKDLIKSNNLKDNILKKSILPLANLLKKKMMKFEEFYKDSTFEIFKENVKEDKILIFVKMSGFKNPLFNQAEFSSWIEFIFYYETYRVVVNFSQISEKSYGTNLSDKEIKEIVNLEIKRHKEFIEEKLNEIEKK